MDKFFKQIEKYKDPSTILFRSIELKLIRSKLNRYFKNKKILDLGCGEGFATKAVFGRQIEWGLDNDDKYLKIAKKNKIFKKTILADGVNVNIKKESVGLVFSNCVIEHIKDINGILKNVNRMLKKDGVFIFTTPSDDYGKWGILSRLGLSFLARKYGLLRDKKFDHYNCNNIKEWEEILNKHGFEVKEYFYYIDKKTMEKWDFYWIFQFGLRFVSKSLLGWIYSKFWRNEIYKIYKNAKVVKRGAGICVVAKKVNV